MEPFNGGRGSHYRMSAEEVLKLWRSVEMRPFTPEDLRAFAGVEDPDTAKIGATDDYTIIEADETVEVYDGDLVGHAAKPRTGINSEAEMVGALREFLDLAEGEDVEGVDEAGGISHVDTFEDVGLLTSNKGLVVTLGNGAQFQIQVVQSRNARRP